MSTGEDKLHRDQHWHAVRTRDQDRIPPECDWMSSFGVIYFLEYPKLEIMVKHRLR
jgi:hypothetical protein